MIGRSVPPHSPRFKVRLPLTESRTRASTGPGELPQLCGHRAIAHARHTPNSGKGLGGSSGMNFLFWTRPQREEIDGNTRIANDRPQK